MSDPRHLCRSLLIPFGVGYLSTWSLVISRDHSSPYPSISPLTPAGQDRGTPPYSPLIRTVVSLPPSLPPPTSPSPHRARMIVWYGRSASCVHLGRLSCFTIFPKYVDLQVNYPSKLLIVSLSPKQRILAQF